MVAWRRGQAGKALENRGATSYTLPLRSLGSGESGPAVIRDPGQLLHTRGGWVPLGAVTSAFKAHSPAAGGGARSPPPSPPPLAAGPESGEQSPRSAQTQLQWKRGAQRSRHTRVGTE